MIDRRHLLALSAAAPLLGLNRAARAQSASPWTEILARARGQTV
jgi:hypothetical protein